jgi:ribosomal-protein-alanine N-acetyltransferase
VTALRSRPLTAADLDSVAAIERAAFSDPWSRRAFGDLLGLDHVRCFVVEQGGDAVVGFAVCSQAADEGEILNLATAPVARRRGVGRALLSAVLQWLGERGAVKVFLEVRRSNEAAIAMYAAAGFTKLGVRPDYYRRPTEDALTMVLDSASQDARK